MSQQTQAPWYEIQNIDAVDSPALVVYIDRVKQNIELLKGMIDEVQRLRPHVKTHKSREVALLQLHAGLKKFKCATIAEAEMLASIEAPDVLLAYQPVGPKMQRFLSLIKNYPRTTFSCLVDNRDVATDLSQKAVAENVTVLVFIDLNVGMNRTGIAPGEQALELYRLCAQLPGLVPKGLHVYDGHITDTDLVLRKQKCDAAFAPVEVLKNMLIQASFEAPVIVVGGSFTFPIHAQRKDVECSPGTFIFWDAGYQQLLPEQPFLPAALVITRVISLPGNHRVCTDLGHKAVAAENVLSRRVRFLNVPDAQFISQSEEHLVFESTEAHAFKIGDVLYGMPFHICPTCNLYERAWVIEKGRVTGQWKMEARDRLLTY